MLILVLMVLAICIISILADEFMVGLVLAGLLALVVSLISKVKELERRLNLQPAESDSSATRVAAAQVSAGWETPPH